MRPLVLIFTAIAFLVTVLFHANVDAQGGAYATGVLVSAQVRKTAVQLFSLDQVGSPVRFGADDGAMSRWAWPQPSPAGSRRRQQP